MARKANKSSGNPFENAFAKRIRDLLGGNNRFGKSVTQEKIASVMDVTRQAVGQYCNGVTYPTVDKLEKLANFFEVSTDYILGRTDIQSQDPQIEEICEYTGLDESAVNRLHSEIALPLALDSEILHDYKLNQSAQINNLISSQFFFELVRLFNHYLFSYKNEKDHLLKYLSALDKKYNKIKNIDDISSTDSKKLDEIDDKIGQLIKERRLSLFELQEYMMEYAKSYSEHGEEEILSLEKAAKKRIDALFMIMGIANIDKEALAKILEKPRDNFDEVYAELTRLLEEKWRKNGEHNEKD